MQTFTITLTAAQSAALEARIRALPGYTDAMLQQGTLPEEDGIELGYTVSRDAQGDASVVFSVLKKPLLIPEHMIQARVEKLIGIHDRRG